MYIHDSELLVHDASVFELYEDTMSTISEIQILL